MSFLNHLNLQLPLQKAKEKIKSIPKPNKCKLALDQITDAVYIINRKKRLVYMNAAYTRLSGYTCEDLLNKKVNPTLGDGKISDHSDPIEDALNKGEPWHGELITMHKSGRTYWVDTVISPYKNKYGRVNGVIVIQKDIGEQKKTETALTEYKNLYRNLIKNSFDGIVFIHNLKLIFANRAFLKMMGFTRDELVNKDLTNIIANDFKEEVISNLKKRSDDEVEVESFQVVFIKKDGSRLSTEIKIKDVVINGEASSLLTIEDISEQESYVNVIRESEAKYKVLVENSQDGITIIRDNRILFANQTYCKMLGYTTDELYNMPSVQTLHPDDHEKAYNIAKRRHEQDFSTINEVFRMVTKNGEIRECETSSTLIEYNGMWASFFTSHDITESKRIQLELQESEEKYRLLFEAESDAIFMIDTENGQIIDVNPAASNIYGYSREEFLAMKNTDVSAEPEKTTEATRRNDTKVLLRYHRKKDNTIFPVELSAGFTTFKNRKIQIVTSRDITDNMKMQDALRESEKKYRELADFMPQTIYELDTKGNLLYMNKSGMEAFGISEADYGMSCLNSFVPEDRDVMMNNLKLTMEGKRIKPMNEYTAVSRSGRIFPVLIYGVPIVKEGMVAGTRGIIIDISERKATEKALRDSEEKYRSLIEKATDGIVITQDGSLKFANQAMSEIMQYFVDEMIDKPYLDFVVPGDHQVMIDFHKRRMQGETFTSIYRSHFIRKDKKIITVELNARTSVYNGRPAAFIVIRDITERINIENELKQAKEDLERLNGELEDRIIESSRKLAETSTQLLNLQKENLQSQFEVLRQQVNPHFLFNSLNVLTSLIKLEPDLAEQFSEHLSKVYRYVLENKDNELVDLNTELRFLDAYIFLLNIRFVGKIKVNIEIPFEKRPLLIIPLAMQLLIENAIKHNIMTKKEPLIIDIFVDEQNYLNIINNLQERPSHLYSTGVGLKNIQNRYKLLINKEPIIEKTEKQFIAKIPLVQKGV